MCGTVGSKSKNITDKEEEAVQPDARNEKKKNFDLENEFYNDRIDKSRREY